MTEVVPVDTLAPAERSRLDELETVIERGLGTFVEVGQALMEVREARLYRAEHVTFKAYCEQRWGFSDSRGRQLIAAAKTVTDVTVAGLPAPKTEGEARRLARQLRQPTSLEQHPLVRGLVADITGAEWIAFVNSIRKHGCFHPIILFEGKILDGWQRYRACQETGVSPTFEEYLGDEPVKQWVSLNLKRASYSEDQRAMIAVRLTEYLGGEGCQLGDDADAGRLERLVEREARINHADEQGVRLLWEMGRALIAVDSKERSQLAGALAVAGGKDPREVRARFRVAMRLAKHYSSESDLERDMVRYSDLGPQLWATLDAVAQGPRALGKLLIRFAPGGDAA